VQAKDQKLGLNDHEDESEIHPKGLSDHSVQANAEPEIETDESQGIY
jgi:hypothetical protein